MAKQTVEGYSLANVTSWIEDNLRDLSTDALDLVQLHCPSTDRWILMFDAVTCAIPGGKRPSQVADNARASDLSPLTPEVMASLRKNYDARIRPLVHQRW